MQDYKVLFILMDIEGKTIGARLQDSCGNIGDVTTVELLENLGTYKLTNALVDKNGFVRSKINGQPLNKIVKNIKPSVEEQYSIMNVKKLLAKKQIILYHGNKDKEMRPKYGVGKDNTDYGVGFYTTPSKELGKEWAYSGYAKGIKGYLHTYFLDVSDLKIFDFTDINSLHWITELLTHRKLNIEYSEVVRNTIEKLKQRYKVDTTGYDIIIGYRADDSYFKYAEDFVSGRIYKETLDRALYYGELGIQVFIKSQKAFDNLIFDSVCEVPENYSIRFKNRDEKARNDYYMLHKRQSICDMDKYTTVYDYIK